MADRPAEMRSIYSRGAIWFHWTIGLLIIANIVIVLLHEAVDKDFGRTMMGWHKANGITVLFLSIARLGWRLAHRPPPMPADIRAWERGLALTVHWAFYALMIVLPLSGWLWMSTATPPRPITFFGLFPLPFLPVDRSKAGADFLHEAHEIMGFTMIGLIALHLAGALKHHFADKSRYLQRMIPALGNG